MPKTKKRVSKKSVKHQLGARSRYSKIIGLIIALSVVVYIGAYLALGLEPLYYLTAAKYPESNFVTIAEPNSVSAILADPDSPIKIVQPVITQPKKQKTSEQKSLEKKLNIQEPSPSPYLSPTVTVVDTSTNNSIKVANDPKSIAKAIQDVQVPIQPPLQINTVCKVDFGGGNIQTYDQNQFVPQKSDNSKCGRCVYDRKLRKAEVKNLPTNRNSCAKYAKYFVDQGERFCALYLNTDTGDFSLKQPRQAQYDTIRYPIGGVKRGKFDIDGIIYRRVLKCGEDGTWVKNR